MNTITLSRYTQLNCITDIYEPKYSTKEVIIAKGKIKKSKLDLKIVFSRVNPTSEYSGAWYLPRNRALKYKEFINNGLRCVSIPFKEFKKISYITREDI